MVELRPPRSHMTPWPVAVARRRESGQAAIVGVVALLVLAVGMYTSYNLARTVYEKVKLQNAADATAYSLATLEARTFNFVAFSNRAQVASYVQVLEAMSLLSNATFTIGMVGYLGDVLQTSGRVLSRIGLLPPSPSLRALGGALQQIGESLEQLHHSLDQQRATERLLTRVQEAMKRQKAVNRAFFLLARGLVLSTAVRLAEGAQDIVQANDAAASVPVFAYLLHAINTRSYWEAFDRESFHPERDDEEAREARRVMAELVNATRYGGQSVAEGIVARAPTYFLSELAPALDGLGQVLGSSGGGSNGRRLRDELSRLQGGLLGAGDMFVGTSKMLTEEGASRERRATGQDESESSYLARGEVLLAKDTLQVPSGSEGTLSFFHGLGESGFASLRASAGTRGRSGEGEYCRYDKARAGDYGGKTTSLLLTPLLVRLGNLLRTPGPSVGFVCERKQEYAWPTGIMPFFDFASPTSGSEAERKGFNQPDVWVWLAKQPDDMALGGSGDLDFTLRRGPEVARLDARIGEGGFAGTGLLPGMNAVARAQVYYHRPGAWQEPPNFFNPFWAARLAPKGVAIERIAEELGVGGLLGQVIADNVLMF